MDNGRHCDELGVAGWSNGNDTDGFSSVRRDECRRARQRSATCTTARSHYTAATNGLGNRNCAALMMLDEHAEACALYSGTLRLTFDMSGGFKAAKPLWRRPLDGRVRPRH